jgi:hypothetical protein
VRRLSNNEANEQTHDGSNVLYLRVGLEQVISFQGRKHSGMDDHDAKIKAYAAKHNVKIHGLNHPSYEESSGEVQDVMSFESPPRRPPLAFFSSFNTFAQPQGSLALIKAYAAKHNVKIHGLNHPSYEESSGETVELPEAKSKT